MVHNICMLDYERIPKKCKRCKYYFESYELVGAVYKPYAGTCRCKYRFEDPCHDFKEKPSIKTAVGDTLREINDHLAQIEILLKQEQEAIAQDEHTK